MLSTCDILEMNVVILFILGTVIMYNVLLILVKQHWALYQIWVIMATFSYILCICCDISEKNGILVIFVTVSRYHVLTTHVKYHLALCQIWVIMPIVFFNCVWCDILEWWVDFVHIWCSNQSRYGRAACKIYIGCVPKCSIYVQYIINCECSDISEMNQCILFILGAVINHKRLYVHQIYFGCVSK